MLDALQNKHPQGGEVNQDALLQEDMVDAPIYHPVVFDTITGDSVRTAVLKCGGGAGPSGLDAAAWQRMCTAYKGRSHDLGNAVALLARRICTGGINSKHVSLHSLQAHSPR